MIDKETRGSLEGLYAQAIVFIDTIKKLIV
jgi:hypothetical protein